MKKWQKIVLSILTIFYAVPLVNFIWPHEFHHALRSTNGWLKSINITPINWHMVIIVFSTILLIGLGLILCLLLFAPVTRLEVILVDTKNGRLELSKQSLASYTTFVAVEHGLKDVRVKVKPTRKQVTLIIHAATSKTSNLQPEIERLRQQITQRVSTFIGDDQMSVNTKLLFDHKPAETRKKARVV